jgi:hypothetical protein
MLRSTYHTYIEVSKYEEKVDLDTFMQYHNDLVVKGLRWFTNGRLVLC